MQPLAQLDADLASWARTGQRLRVDAGAPGDVPAPALSPIQTWSPTAHFIAWLRSAAPQASVSNAFADVARVRMVKSAREIALMRKAARLSVDGIAHAAGFVRDGVDERSLEAEFESFCKRGGAQRLPFASIIKSGPNACGPGASSPPTTTAATAPCAMANS
ncbi:MAG: M24 family metallopeptidase [Vicinamibacterales bacterium]